MGGAIGCGLAEGHGGGGDESVERVLWVNLADAVQLIHRKVAQSGEHQLAAVPLDRGGRLLRGLGRCFPGEKIKSHCSLRQAWMNDAWNCSR